MKFKNIILVSVGCGIAIAVNELNASMHYAKGAVDAFHEIQKNSDVQEVKIKVPFFGKKIDFKVSKY